MTPKKQAQELINKHSKECALIAVNVILDFCNKLYQNNKMYTYFLEVKKYIELID